MSTVFLDTVGLLALWDDDDQWHHAAQEAFRTLLSARSRIVTTTFVLLECGNGAARRPYRIEVSRFRRALASRGEMITPTDTDLDTAWDEYERGVAGETGIVDHISFAVTRPLGLTSAFTNDRHFRTAGFHPLF